MKNLIKKLIPKLDKLEHIYLWTLIFFVSILFLDVINYIFNLSLNSQLIAIIIVNVTAFLKETLHDYFQDKGNCEILDFLFSVMFPNFIYFYL